jgi:hypothetical protein
MVYWYMVEEYLRFAVSLREISGSSNDGIRFSEVRSQGTCCSPSSGESLGIGGGGRSKYPRSLVRAGGTVVCEDVEVDILWYDGMSVGAGVYWILPKTFPV